MSDDDLTYRRAQLELEGILAELEDDAVDVDVLAEKVRRAATLIRFCRARITEAQMEIEQVVADLDAPGSPGPEPSADTHAETNLKPVDDAFATENI